ncbi:uncharacterized protein LY89DRAFT_777951 [Mollisia scopiformis]|uniref:Uncharacterized protein n=1 Tax=Mollisia scopiformis TaxID=149040 RepID=A0A194XMY7_MOLSC|nr:uncharacterized protein LY89DRAFT_777951 [Mollisia scopiformis]KUJ21523.1 hypothetical protein LY89DRAFT_777951 [Mollisia scopiformis]
MSSSKNPSSDPNAMENIPLQDNYEPQHQYQEPSEEVERQLKVATASPDLEPQNTKAPAPKRKPGPPPRTGTGDTQSSGRKEGAVSKITGKAKGYGKSWWGHVKKGEMPWIQWYCCGVVDGHECDTMNNRMSKECKKCKHKVCNKCVKAKT